MKTGNLELTTIKSGFTKVNKTLGLEWISIFSSLLVLTAFCTAIAVPFWLNDVATKDQKSRIEAKADKHTYAVNDHIFCNAEDNDSAGQQRTWVPCEVVTKDREKGYYSVTYNAPDNNKTVTVKFNVLDMREK